MGKSSNNKADTQDCSGSKQCGGRLVPILITRRKSKETKKKKKVRFNLQGLTTKSKGSGVKKPVKNLFAHPSKKMKANYLGSQSCISMERSPYACRSRYIIPKSLCKPFLLSPTNCNSNSGSNNVGSCRSDATSLIKSPNGKMSRAVLENAGTISSLSEDNCHLAGVTRCRYRIKQNGQAEFQRSIHGEENEVANVSSPMQSLAGIILDMSNVSVGNQTKEDGVPINVTKTQNQVTCGTSPNSEADTMTPMEEDLSDMDSCEETNTDRRISNGDFCKKNGNNNNNDTESDHDESDWHKDVNLNGISRAIQPTHHHANISLEQECNHHVNGINKFNTTGTEDVISVCPVLNCGLFFDDSDKFMSHISQLNHNPCNPLATLLNGELAETQRFLCPVCGLAYRVKETCWIHMESTNHLPLMSPVPFRVFACPQCLSFFPSSSLTQEHMDSVAHNSFAISFKDDVNMSTSPMPIPVPDRVVEIVTKSCENVPHSLFCLESQGAVTSLDQLIYLIDEMHMVFAKCSTTIVDVLSTLVTDQACAECSQVMIGCVPSSLCIHTSCPMNGGVLAMQPRSLCSFIRRCGITDTVALHSQSPETYTSTLPPTPNTSSNADPRTVASTSPQSNSSFAKGSSVLEKCRFNVANSPTSICESQNDYVYQYEGDPGFSQDIPSHEDIPCLYGVPNNESIFFPSTSTVTDDRFDFKETDDDNMERQKRYLETQRDISSSLEPVSDVSYSVSSDRLRFDQMCTDDIPQFVLLKASLFSNDVTPVCMESLKGSRHTGNGLDCLQRFDRCHVANTFLDVGSTSEVEKVNISRNAKRMPDMKNATSYLSDSKSYIDGESGSTLPDRFESLYYLATRKDSEKVPWNHTSTSSQTRNAIEKTEKCSRKSKIKRKKRKVNPKRVTDSFHVRGVDGEVCGSYFIKCPTRKSSFKNDQNRKGRLKKVIRTTGNRFVRRTSTCPTRRVVPKSTAIESKRSSKVMVIENVSNRKYKDFAKKQADSRNDLAESKGEQSGFRHSCVLMQTKDGLGYQREDLTGREQMSSDSNKYRKLLRRHRNVKHSMCAKERGCVTWLKEDRLLKAQSHQFTERLIKPSKLIDTEQTESDGYSPNASNSKTLTDNSSLLSLGNTEGNAVIPCLKSVSCFLGDTNDCVSKCSENVPSTIDNKNVTHEVCHEGVETRRKSTHVCLENGKVVRRDRPDGMHWPSLEGQSGSGDGDWNGLVVLQHGDDLAYQALNETPSHDLYLAPSPV